MDVKIRFSDRSLPPIANGRCRISLEFNADAPGREHLADGTETIELMVTRKRFTLAPEEIYSVYPPAGSCGDYRLHLPHVIFERASLPWEFTSDGIPALAVFLESQGEGCQIQEMPLSEIQNTDRLTFVSPELTWRESDADPADGTCRIVDIPVGLFQILRVEREERKLLTHVREVSLEDKATDSSVKNGLFAGLIGNRFPEGPAQEETGPQINRAYVVSMWEYDGMEVPDNMEYVRCLCLHSWEFSVNRKIYDFSRAILRLKTGTFCRDLPPEVKDPRLRELLKRGYLPINHDMRDGSRTVSWYRSPWVPSEEPVEPRPYSVFSDELYYCDPECGMLDLSYACAWQIGRMTAAHYSTTANEILRWRFKNYRDAVVKWQQRKIIEELPHQRESLEASIQASFAAAAGELPSYEEENHDPKK